jgi:putative membrane protein
MTNTGLIAFDAHPLVHLNAGLNALATVLLLVGYILIKRGARQAHGWVMLSAFGVSCAFLVSYLTYHFTVVWHVKFTHPGPVKVVYLSILFSHIVLAATVPFLAAASIAFAILGRGFGGAMELPSTRSFAYLSRHRRLSQWTLPIWLYVSVTGVVVYLMLYHIWPPTTG